MKKEHLPGHVVQPPPPEAGCNVARFDYVASTGLSIPVEIHCHPGGLIERLWREEQERRLGPTQPKQLGPEQVTLIENEPKPDDPTLPPGRGRDPGQPGPLP